MRLANVLAPLAVFTSCVQAIQLDPTNRQSIIDASNLIVTGLMDYYTGNDTGKAPGMFSDPYYWWEAGVAWGTMLDHYYYTGNDTYADLIKTSILYQSGDYWNFMTYNQTSTEGNDDQAFWGVTAMAAAEKNFTAPGKGYPGSWLYFAQATFNTMASRWDTEHCNGGLRWQIYTWNAGYNYKNTVATGALFHMAARLYRFTGNETFLDWADKTWDWLLGVKFLNATNTQNLSAGAVAAFDGASLDQNCTQVGPYEWTYNQGLMMSGTAYLYNATGDPAWHDRLRGLWNRAQVFFLQDEKDGGRVMYEAACQPLKNSTGGWAPNRCNNDQRCFKGIFSRFLALTMQMVPETYDWGIWEMLIETSTAMAQSCSGGTDGHTCGLNWLVDGWDGMYGLGEQICALDLLNTLQYHTKPGPLRASDLFTANGEGSDGKNGTVYGYGDAGLNSTTVNAQPLKLGTKDKAGAGVLTAVVLLILIGASTYLVL